MATTSSMTEGESEGFRLPIGCAEAILQEDIPIAGPLRTSFVWGDVRSVENVPAKVGEVVKTDLFDSGFGDEGPHTDILDKGLSFTNTEFATEEPWKE